MSVNITFDDKHLYVGHVAVADIRADLPTVYRRELESFIINRYDSTIKAAIKEMYDKLCDRKLDDSLLNEIGVLVDAHLLDAHLLD